MLAILIEVPRFNTPLPTQIAGEEGGTANCPPTQPRIKTPQPGADPPNRVNGRQPFIERLGVVQQ